MGIDLENGGHCHQNIISSLDCPKEKEGKKYGGYKLSRRRRRSGSALKLICPPHTFGGVGGHNKFGQRRQNFHILTI